MQKATQINVRHHMQSNTKLVGKLSGNRPVS